MNKVAIIANGSIVDYTLIRNLIKGFPQIIAVDGGLSHCRKMNLTPSLMIGDFDSASTADVDHYSAIPKKQFSTHKDETDMELAILEATKLQAEKIVLFGALGKRIDHGLVNINLLYKMPDILQIESEFETLFALFNSQTITCTPGQTISLIPFGVPATGISTQGLKWELQDAKMDNSFLSISNICIKSTFNISIKSGIVLCSLVRAL